MGATFTCLASRQAKQCDDYSYCIATLSPAHSLRRRSSCSSGQGSATGSSIGTLQDVAVETVGRALRNRRIGTRELSVLPIDLLQRVIDYLAQQGEFVGLFGRALLTVISSSSIQHLQGCDGPRAGLHCCFYTIYISQTIPTYPWVSCSFKVLLPTALLCPVLSRSCLHSWAPRCPVPVPPSGHDQPLAAPPAPGGPVWVRG